MSLVLLLGLTLCLAPPANDQWAGPFGGEGLVYPVTQRFAAVGHVMPGHLHTGVDVAAPCGTPVSSLADGEVISVTDGEGHTSDVVIRHRDRTGRVVYVQLAHLARVDVNASDAVARGQVVGVVAPQRRGGRCHLHLALRIGEPPGAGYLPTPPALVGYLDPEAALRHP